MTKNPVPPHPFHSMRGARIWLEEKHMTKILKIGLVAGVNPIVAPFVKAAIDVGYLPGTRRPKE